MGFQAPFPAAMPRAGKGVFFCSRIKKPFITAARRMPGPFHKRLRQILKILVTIITTHLTRSSLTGLLPKNQKCYALSKQVTESHQEDSCYKEETYEHTLQGIPFQNFTGGSYRGCHTGWPFSLCHADYGLPPVLRFLSCHAGSRADTQAVIACVFSLQ